MTQEAAIKFKEEIKAFQEGKQIQVFTRKWVDDDNPSFSIKSKYRVKPEGQKTIVEKSIDGITWYEIGKVPTELNNKMKFVRLRIIGEEKPKPTKRLPTIEEVEQWFLENRVFLLKCTNTFYRIESFTKHPKQGDNVIYTGEWYTIKEFCEDHAHYDGSSLYITE